MVIVIVIVIVLVMMCRTACGTQRPATFAGRPAISAQDAIGNDWYTCDCDEDVDNVDDVDDEVPHGTQRPATFAGRPAISATG